MGMSFDGTIAMVFTDEDAALEVYDMIEEIKNETDVNKRYITDSHCEGDVGTPVYDVQIDEERNVVTFNSSGYGTYNLSNLKLSAKAHYAFAGWVQMVTPCQGDDTYLVWDGFTLWDEDDQDQYDFYDKCTPLAEWADYPKEEDYQQMDEDDEVICDEEAYEFAVDKFNDNVSEMLQEEFNERINSYVESVN